MEISVILTSHWVTIEKPLSIMKNVWKIAEEIGDRAGEGRAMEISVMLTSHWVTIDKPPSIMKKI